MRLAAEWHDPDRTVTVLPMEHGWTWEEWNAIVEEILSMRASISYLSRMGQVTGQIDETSSRFIEERHGRAARLQDSRSLRQVSLARPLLMDCSN